MNDIYRKYIKRLIDVVFSLIGLIVLSPMFLIIFILIKLESKGPALFKQKRFGLHKKPFDIIKFRTMYVNSPQDMPSYLFTDHEKYITKVGRFLRKTSLDELPQIINIFVGQMSIVGPRPVVLKEEELIRERDKYKANDIRPGLTGWAQINGRDQLLVEDKAKYDGEYVYYMSFLFDFKCFFTTIIKVLKREGIVEGTFSINIEKMDDINDSLRKSEEHLKIETK